MSLFAGQEGKTPIWRTDLRVGTRAGAGRVGGGLERPGGPRVDRVPGGHRRGGAGAESSARAAGRATRPRFLPQPLANPHAVRSSPRLPLTSSFLFVLTGTAEACRSSFTPSDGPPKPAPSPIRLRAARLVPQ